MKKKLLSVALIASLVLSAAGCGETKSTATADGSTTIVDNKESAKKTEIAEKNAEEAETTEKEAIIEEIKVGSDKLVPDCPVTHTDRNLGEICSDGVPYLYVNEFTTCGELEMLKNYTNSSSPVPHVSNDVDFYFESILFEGINFEFVKDGEVAAQEYDGSHFGYRYKTEEFFEHEIKGCAFYSKEGEYNTKESLTFNGVTLSMRREDVEAILGEGHVGTNQEFPTVMYNDGNVTMVIEYFPYEPTFKFEDTPDIIERVQTIYLIRNN